MKKTKFFNDKNQWYHKYLSYENGSLKQDELNALLAGKEEPINLKEFLPSLADRLNSRPEGAFARENVNIFQGPHITVTKKMISETYSSLSKKEPQAITKIGNVEIIPINHCPKCKNFHYDEEVQESYNTSNPSKKFSETNRKLSHLEVLRKWRTENRTICCKKCNTYFQPTIVYCQTETTDPYFCKYQAIDALKKWFKYITEEKVHFHLFSPLTDTVITENDSSILYWDVFLDEPVNGLEKCPKGILTNLIRYTPVNDLEKMLDGKKRVPVFDSFPFQSFCV